MRGAQDRASQITARLRGWNPTEIIGDAYDVEKAGPWKDNPGPDSPAGTLDIAANDKPWQSPEQAATRGPSSHPFPGKPL